MTIDYQASLPEWAVALFLLGWLVLVVGIVGFMWLEWRDRR